MTPCRLYRATQAMSSLDYGLPQRHQDESTMPNPPTFRDHFSGHASDYSRYRPRYPQTLFDWLASLIPETTRVWDCGTGNGQAAVALARHFSSVHATDASPEQIAAAQKHDRVHYAVASAAKSGLQDDAVNLITVAQALHWFEPHPFHQEVERVLQPGGIVAAWCYEIFKLNTDFDAALDTLYRDILGKDWPPQRRHIETGYRLFDWPWPKMPPPNAAQQQLDHRPDARVLTHMVCHPTMEAPGRHGSCSSGRIGPALDLG